MPRKFSLLSFSLLLLGCACIAQPPKTYRIIDVAETGDAGIVSSDINITLKGFGRLEKRAGKPVSLSGESLVNMKMQ